MKTGELSTYKARRNFTKPPFALRLDTAPMEAKAADVLPDETGQWQYELKWDGFRCLAFKAGGRAADAIAPGGKQDSKTVCRNPGQIDPLRYAGQCRRRLMSQALFARRKALEVFVRSAGLTVLELSHCTQDVATATKWLGDSGAKRCGWARTWHA